jgi:hypothetical protein
MRVQVAKNCGLNFIAFFTQNTEGPLRLILQDVLTDERAKLPLRFSYKKISNTENPKKS